MKKSTKPLVFLPLTAVALLLPDLASANEAPSGGADPARLERIQRRFGSGTAVQSDQPVDLPELPVEEDGTGRSFFGTERDDPGTEVAFGPGGTAPMAARPPPPTRRGNPLAAGGADEEPASGWGWLHDEITRTRQEEERRFTAEAETLRLQQESGLFATDSRYADMTETDIQRMAQARIEEQYKIAPPELKLPDDTLDEQTQLSPFMQSSRQLHETTSLLRESLTPQFTRRRIAETEATRTASRPGSPLLIDPLRDHTVDRAPSFFSAAPRPNTMESPADRRPSPADSYSMKWKEYLTPETRTPTSVSNRPEPDRQNDRFQKLRQMPALQADIDNLTSEDAFPRVRTSVWE